MDRPSPSRGRAANATRAPRPGWLFVFLALLSVQGIRPATAQAQLTRDEGLELAFPTADRIQRHTAYLTDEERSRAVELAGPGVEVESGVVNYYVATRNGTPLGVAYFDAHLVRTLQEVLMVVVDPRGSVERVETVSFREPPEYMAPEGWLALFHERPLDQELSLKGEIPNLTGATLTAGAVTGAVRRVLALHRVIRPLQPADPQVP